MVGFFPKFGPGDGEPDADSDEAISGRKDKDGSEQSGSEEVGGPSTYGLPSTLGKCYHLAGICGVDPGPLTWRKLEAMADARDRAEWNRAAWLSCDIANSFRMDDESPALEPGDRNPYILAERARRAAKGGQKAKKSENLPYNPNVLENIQKRNEQLRGR